MPQLFISLVARILSGERLEKAERADYRFWFGALALTPAMILATIRWGETFLNQPTVMLWLTLTGIGLVFVITMLAWTRWVPASLSLLLAAIAWGGVFYQIAG